MYESLKSDWKLKWWGFFNEEMEKVIGRDIIKGEAIDENWEPENRQAIAQYLDQGHNVLTALSWRVKCRFCGQSLDNSSVKSDGEWVWPAHLGHNVEHHGYFIPDAMLASIREKAFKMPPKESVDLSKVDWPTKPQPLTEEQRRAMEAVLYEEEGR